MRKNQPIDPSIRAALPGILALSVAGRIDGCRHAVERPGGTLGLSRDAGSGYVAGLAGGGTDEGRCRQGAHGAILAEVDRLRKILSTYETGTDLGKVNASRGPVKVSPEVIEVLKLYDEWRQKSKGAFSGRLGGMIQMWQDAEKKGMPMPAVVDAQVAAEKKELWKIDEAVGTVQRLGEGAINIDSLGKGFIVSRAAAAGKAASPGVRGLLLNIGGDITTEGTSSRTGIQEWTVGITDPAHPAENDKALTYVKITGMSVATSASYDRKYTLGATKLSHIIDPRNGYPIDSEDAPKGPHNPLVLSATVIARDNAAANALATSLCVLTPQEGLAADWRDAGGGGG